MTEKTDGLLLYNGPIGGASGKLGRTDFIALDLHNGNPRLFLDLGFGRPLTLEVKPKIRLSDGSWHRLDVYLSGQTARIVVDWCQKSNITDPEEGYGVSDLSACEARGQTLGFQTGLNVHQPLQIGGVTGETGEFILFVAVD